MKTAQVKAHFANWRAWELNPIVLKELRQAVRSWAVTGMLLLFLLVLFVASIGFMVTQSFSPGGQDDMGINLFSAFLVILAVAGVLFIPLYTGFKVAAERQENNPDLLYISTLSPGRIIRGKFLCGAYLALLFFSACVPFMALTNLMRGVDLPTIAFLLVFLFIVVCEANLGAIFIACLPITKLFKGMLGLAGFGLLIFVLSATIGLAFEMLHSGVGEMIFQRVFWNGAGVFLFLASGAAGLCYVLSVSLVAPPSANRALLPRIYVTAYWLVSGGVAAYMSHHNKTADALLTWVIIGGILFAVTLLNIVSNNDWLSVRVRRTIPKLFPLRLLAFCFYNGAAGGLLWLAGLTTLTYLALSESWLVMPVGSSDPHIIYFVNAYPAIAIYFVAYALFGLFFQRHFLHRFSPKLAGLLTVLIVAATALGTDIVLFFSDKLTWQAADHLELGNAFNVLADHSIKQCGEHLAFAVVLFLIAFAMNAKWFATQWKNFFSPADRTPPVI